MARNIRLIAAGTEDTHDLCLNEKRQLAEVTGIDAYAQIINCKLRTLLGEKQLNLADGIPYLQTVFSDISTLPIFTSEIRKTLESLPFVIKVNDISTSIDDGVLSYRAVILTDIGTTGISGNVNERQVADSNKRKILSIENAGDQTETEDKKYRIIKFVTSDGDNVINPIVARVGESVSLPNYKTKNGYFYVTTWKDLSGQKFYCSTPFIMPDTDIVLYSVETHFGSNTKLRFNFSILDVLHDDIEDKNYLEIPMTFWGFSPAITIKVWSEFHMVKYNKTHTKLYDYKYSQVYHPIINPPISRRQKEDMNTGKKETLKIYIPSGIDVGDEYIYYLYVYIEIGPECYKFRVGHKDIVATGEDPDKAQIAIQQVYALSDTLKNLYRTFSCCPNLVGQPPSWPIRMHINENMEGLSIIETSQYNLAGRGCVSGAYERTKISDNIPGWINGITVADYCFADCSRLKARIPPITDFGEGNRLVNVEKMFRNTPVLAPLNTSQEEMTPSFVTSHNGYVSGSPASVQELYPVDWGGTKQE